MKRAAEKISGEFSPSAKVVDGTLILSLPDALTPVVWRLDLGQTKASALEVRSAENGLHTLVLKTPRGETHDIAPYDNKAGAVRALMAVSRAMEQAQPSVANDSGRSHVPALIPAAAAGRARPRKVLTATAAVVLVAVLLLAALNIGPRRASVPGMETGEAASSIAPATGGMTGSSESGVPVSADTFLQQNRE